MKFLCGNCKAKYQIADEKISGRTLRMKCRRCQHDIIIRGQEQAAAAPAAAAAGAARAPAAPRRPGGPAPKRAPSRGSALGADFRRSVGGPQPKAPAPAPPPPPAELWHVAINDVPVGPIRREEVEKKIQTGAVNGESLCWREGFDDWRPLRDVAELASLLRKQRPPPPSHRPPTGKGIGRRHESRPRIRPSSRPGAADSSRPPAPVPDNVVPIGGRLGGSAAPDIEPYEEEPTRVGAPVFEEEAGPTVPDPKSDFGSLPKPAATLSAIPGASPGSAPPPAPESDPLADMFGPADASASAAAGPALAAPPASPPVDVALSEPPRRRKRAIPIGAWIAIAAAGAFGVTLAVFVATNLLTQPEPVADATTATDNEAEATTAEPDLILDEGATEEVEGETEVEEETEEEGTTSTGGGGMRRASMSSSSGSTTAMRELTAEQQALIDRMGGAGSAGANINTDELGSSSMMNNRPQLTENQLRTTVNNNRRSLQRCYELAIRGAGEPPTIRLDVQVTIAESGRVTRVSATGRDFGGMKACVTSNVRRWRFPASGGSTATQFPVVFQPGG
jgi:predicted Zn finger-like uncharacterized protein